MIEGSPCWEWPPGRRTKAGYGQYRRRYVHRIVAALVLGPITGKQVCHHCDNPPCYRPDHLFIGSHSENMADARRKGRAYIQPPSTACARGHPFDEANTYVGTNGRQNCRQCSRDASKRRWHANGGAAKQRAWRAAHPDYWRQSNGPAKQREARKGRREGSDGG